MRLNRGCLRFWANPIRLHSDLQANMWLDRLTQTGWFASLHWLFLSFLWAFSSTCPPSFLWVCFYHRCPPFSLSSIYLFLSIIGISLLPSLSFSLSLYRSIERILAASSRGILHSSYREGGNTFLPCLANSRTRDIMEHPISPGNDLEDRRQRDASWRQLRTRHRFPRDW